MKVWYASTTKTPRFIVPWDIEIISSHEFIHDKSNIFILELEIDEDAFAIALLDDNIFALKKSEILSKTQMRMGNDVTYIIEEVRDFIAENNIKETRWGWEIW